MTRPHVLTYLVGGRLNDSTLPMQHGGRAGE